jgi:hypothetical protein
LTIKNNEEAAQRLIQSERVSLRAVVVPEGQDVTPYLREAGIADPVSLPFAPIGNGASAAGMTAIWTSDVTAELDFGDDGDPDSPMPFTSEQDNTASNSDELVPTEKSFQTMNLPEAFGMRPLAPVRRRP